MTTTHVIHHGDARHMRSLADESIDLVVTSPPYPMIQMWDALFATLDPTIRDALASGDGQEAFGLMHACLDAIWKEVARVLKPGGFVCINVGDATRTIGGVFRLFPNHVRILSSLESLGLVPLPDVLWRKQTNAPNKFLGSGVLPAGAYVTLEHEYLLIARKGPKRTFASEEQRRLRRESALFWEERNAWFSDVWMDMRGAGQDLPAHAARARSGAYPPEIPYRLIMMYSVKGDTVLDPFLGTGTTSVAALAAARNSVGWELDEGLCEIASSTIRGALPWARQRCEERIRAHVEFVARRKAAGEALAYRTVHHGFEVVTAQERHLLLEAPAQVRQTSPGCFEASYVPVTPEPSPQP